MTVPYYALLYDVVDGYVERRAAYREEHLALARGSGRLLLGGAFADPVDGALLVFQADDASAVEDFARRDPYVREGLVTRWRVRPWSVVVGSLAEA